MNSIHKIKQNVKNFLYKIKAAEMTNHDFETKTESESV